MGVIIPVTILIYLLQAVASLKGGAVESFPKGNIGDTGVT